MNATLCVCVSECVCMYIYVFIYIYIYIYIYKNLKWSVSFACICFNICIYCMHCDFGVYNLKIVNFLDVTLNISENSYKPFNKTNTIPTCINVNSHQPTSIVKQIPNVIIIRINRLSSSKNIFNNHKEFYNEALHNSGCKNELQYFEANWHHKNRKQ